METYLKEKKGHSLEVTWEYGTTVLLHITLQNKPRQTCKPSVHGSWRKDEPHSNTSMHRSTTMYFKRNKIVFQNLMALSHEKYKEKNDYSKISYREPVLC
ncbi:hypothetical protein Y1Q_0021209 [Alligator mississippiensis]|uniref:Uncharacterized protein n=1 Tax=Alligator mississippiensis TaxID=8496 RepID=A0A151MRW8_ALLMI|nr:hypothetical protein Y1Q_0021209 [Alligator mississippiensis]